MYVCSFIMHAFPLSWASIYDYSSFEHLCQRGSFLLGWLIQRKGLGEKSPRLAWAESLPDYCSSGVQRSLYALGVGANTKPALELRWRLMRICKDGEFMARLSRCWTRRPKPLGLGWITLRTGKEHTIMDVKNLSPRQFFQDFYGCDNCTVTYRIFEY